MSRSIDDARRASGEDPASTKRIFAQDVIIDHEEGQVWIDGVRLPYWFEAEGPTVRKVRDVPIHVVELPIFVEGIVEVRGDGGARTIHDPVLGDVRKWAREYVRNALTERFPDLNV